MPTRHHPDGRANLPDPCGNGVPPRGSDLVTFVQEADVADAELLPEKAPDALGALSSRCAALQGLEVPSIADTDHAVELEGRLHKGVCKEGLRHWHHLRKSGALDDKAIQLGRCRNCIGGPDIAGNCGRRPLRQATKRVYKVPTHTATEASVRHDDDLGVASFHKHELVIHRDTPKLILHDSDALSMPLTLQHKVQEGRLAGA
mmetsp:Transcript_16218/g.36637  ORF Transcript_16218/g.36637 Transcript_16218/m.36637 type:complete len:203 (+) Transcript_16218:594-1202(+)